MSEFFVEKLIWEYGEDYGHVYYPRDLPDLKKKIEELDTWGQEKDYPFLIEMRLTDHSHVGFSVAHEYSFVEFGYRDNGEKKGPVYLTNPDGNVDELVPIYYFASYTEPDTTKMLPLQQVLEAIYHFVKHGSFPSYIEFNDEETNKKFVQSYKSK